jgi:DNA-binding Xre family transcriptional regulator
MSPRREFRKMERTPEQKAELKAVREHYQSVKPTLQDVLAENGRPEPTALGEVMALHVLTKQLRAERMKQNITLAEMEQRTGIAQATISRLETGKSENPTIATLWKLAHALGKRIECTLAEDVPV